MKVVKKKGENGFLIYDATASTQEVSQALNQASEQFCQQMGIAPVAGKTPAQAVSERLGIKDLDSVIASQAIEMLIPRAIDKQGIVPAFTPDLKADMPLKRGRAFQFTLEVMPKPSYELSDYSPVKFVVQPFQPDEEEIDRQIGLMAKEYMVFVPTEAKPIHAGDSCKLNLKTTKDGEVVPGLTIDGRSYTLGEDLMPKGFDEGLDGMVVGETRTFTFEGPGLDENFNEIMEAYECTATLVEVQKEVVPVVNDEWIKKNMPMYKDYDDMRAKIGEEINKERMKYYEDYKRNAAASKLAERFDGRIADEVYEGAMRDEQRTMRQQVAAAGVTWDEFVEQQGGEQQVSMMMMMSMRQNLVQGYALDAYYRHHNLSYTDDDLNEACFQINPRDPKYARRQMEKNGLGYALREAAERLRACKHLVETADISIAEQ